MMDAHNRRKLKVAVLMGGDSAERDVSLHTGEQVLAALDRRKYDAFAVDAIGLKTLGAPLDAALNTGSPLDAKRDVLPLPRAGGPDPSDIGPVPALAGEALPTVWTERPDVVFIALHGPGGEDGAVQGMLETMGLPYTGSGVLASALAMDKAMCKRVLRAEGMPTPWSRLVTSADTDLADVPLPVVVKPNRQGSSFGLTIVREAADLPAAIEKSLLFDSACLLEEFVSGTEITVSALGNEDPRVLPAIEIVPKGEYYDYASKYEDGGSEHIIPARISPEAMAKAEDYARRCHVLLGCRGMSRTDIMVRGDDVTVLEVNTIPGMTRTSLLPHAAAAAGISFSEVLDGLIQNALKR